MDKKNRKITELMKSIKIVTIVLFVITIVVMFVKYSLFPYFFGASIVFGLFYEFLYNLKEEHAKNIGLNNKKNK